MISNQSMIVSSSHTRTFLYSVRWSAVVWNTEADETDATIMLTYLGSHAISGEIDAWIGLWAGQPWCYTDLAKTKTQSIQGDNPIQLVWPTWGRSICRQSQGQDAREGWQSGGKQEHSCPYCSSSDAEVENWKCGSSELYDCILLQGLNFSVNKRLLRYTCVTCPSVIWSLWGISMSVKR